MKNKKKLISLYSMIVGTLLVVAGLFSFGVYAALNFNATTNGILNYTDKVCYIKGETDSDNVYYPSLNSALASVTDGGTICVFKDVTMGANITITKNVTIQGVYKDTTINMGSNYIEVNKGKTLNLGNGDKILTIQSSVISSDFDDKSMGVLVNNGTLNLNQKLNITSTAPIGEGDVHSVFSTAVVNKGTLLVNGATLSGVSAGVLSLANTKVTVQNSLTKISGKLVGIYADDNALELNVSGGTITGGTSNSDEFGIAVMQIVGGESESANITISGNPIITGGQYGMSISASSTNLTGTISISGNPQFISNGQGEDNTAAMMLAFGDKVEIAGGTFTGGVILIGSSNIDITGGNIDTLAMSLCTALIGGTANISTVEFNNGTTNSYAVTLSGTPTITTISNQSESYTTESYVGLLIDDTYAPTTKAKIEFPLDGSCNYIAKYTGSKNASASIFDSSIISASGKYLKTRGFTTTVADNGGSLKGVIDTYYPSSKSQSVVIGSNTKTGSTLTGYTVAWADTTHSATLPTATTSALTIPATAYGNISLTPAWNTHTYTIKYNGNGSTGGSTANSTHTYGVAKELTANGYTKTGYTFAGWATSANGAVVYKDKQSVTSLTAENGATIELFAKWTANKYKVRYYDTYANTTTYTEVEYTYDNSTLKFPNGSLDSFTFVGWVNSATNLSPGWCYEYNTAVSNLTATNNAIINVYSLYSRNVTVSYNGNGATSGSTASETKTQYYNRPGSKATSPEFTVATNGFTKTGYAFTNWTNGSTTYAPGAKITPFTDQNVVTPFTLTAQWSQNKSTIKLGTMTNITKVEYKEGENGTYKELTTAGFAANSNTDYYFKATLATASGYTITFTNFTGWFTDSANPSSAHKFTAGGQTYTVNAIASKVQNTATIKRGDITNVTKVYYSTDKTNWVELTTTGFTANSNTSYYFKADLATATGYTVKFKTFGGWFTDTANPSSAHSFTEKGTYTVTASADKTIDTYTITYDLDGGTVSTANPTSYTVETATFTLNNPTKTGYTFTGWTGSNGTTAQTSVSIAKGTTGNKNYKANWSINKFDVTIVSNNTAYGTVDVAKVANVPYGSKVTVSGNTITVNGTKVTATASQTTAQYSYAFSSWSVANNEPITGATTITATFTRTVNNYTVTIAVGQSGYGTVSTTSVANVPYGTVIKVGSSANIIGVNGTNVTATPTTKTAQYTYTFNNWTSGSTTLSTTAGVTVTGATTITANFARTTNNYTVTIAVGQSGYGSVSTTSLSVPYGATVKVGSSANILVVNTTNVTATPTTKTAQYTYKFNNWTSGSTTLSTSTGVTVTGATTITANFARTVNNYTVTIVVGQSGYGSVSTTSVANVPYGTVIKVGSSGNIIVVNTTNVTATPTTKTAQYTYTFSNWTSGSTTLSTTAGVTVTGATTITANFARTTNNYTVTIAVGQSGYGSVSTASVTVPYGSAIKVGSSANIIVVNTTNVTATPTTKTAQYTYTFNNWTSGSTTLSTSSSLTVTANVTVTANFARTVNNYTVTIAVGQSGYGTVSTTSVASVPYGTVIKVGSSANIIGVNGTNVTATPTAKTAQYTYTFSNWTSGSTTLSTTAGVTVTGATTITANFARTTNTYTVTVTVNNSNYGSVDKTSIANVPYGTKLSVSSNVLTVISGTTVTATPKTATGYDTKFDSWTNGTATVQGNLTVTANFTRTVQGYTITWDGNATQGDLLQAELWDYAGGAYTSSNNGSRTSYSARTGVKPTSKVTYATAISYKTPLPIRRGYVFNGWYTSATNGTKVADTSGSLIASVSGYTDANKKWIKAGDTTLYAQYTARTYTIAYDYAGGSHSTNPTSYTVASETTIEVPTRTGYTFAGWEIVTNLNKMYDATINISSGILEYSSSYPNATFYEMFRMKAGTSYTGATGNGEIRWRLFATDGTFATGSGSGNVSTDSNVALWYHLGKSEATTTISFSYGASSINTSTLALTGNLTLKAKWNVNTYTVTIAVGQSGYGTVSTTSVANVPYGTVIKVGSSASIIGVNGTNVTATPATKTTQYTYTFNNWTSGSTTLSTTAGVTVTGATTITANFARTTNKYTATFDANGGTTPNPASITKEYNSEIGTLPTTTRANYVFNGWYTAKTNGTKITTTTKITGNVTYYAQWTSAQAKIGSNYFVTLGDAVTYANNNSTSSHTIELLVNTLTISSTLNINANVTIKEVSGITNATIKRNVTAATFNMFNVTAGKSLTISGNSKSDLITLDGQGGAGIYSLIANNGTLSVSYVKFYNNNALSTSNTAKPNVRGGAIHGLDGSTTSISNCTFDSNKANYGGALLFETTAIISGISNSEFTNNTAYKYGGAVYLCGGTDIKFTSCKFTSNTLGGASGRMGDAFYIQLTNTTFDSCEFTSNTNKSYTIHIESSDISADNRYTVTFNNTTVSGSQLIHVNNVLNYKQEHLLTINGGTIANINIATTAKTYTPVYIGSSSTISKITFGQSSTLSSEASTKAIAFASSTLYNSMSSTIIANTTVPSGYSPVGDGSTAINCNKVYTITLNANGGTGGSVSPSTYTIKSSAQTVTLTRPTRDGYSFSSWTASKGTVSGNTLTIPANTTGNITVTANWTHNDVSVTHGSTVTYYTGGEKALTDALAKATSGDTITLLTNIDTSNSDINIPASADGVTITSGSYTFTGYFVISALHVNFVKMNIVGGIDSYSSGITDNHEILIERCKIYGNSCYAIVPGNNSYIYIVESILGNTDMNVFSVKGDNAHIYFKAGSIETSLSTSNACIMYSGAQNTEVVFDGSIKVYVSDCDYVFSNIANIDIMATCSSIDLELHPKGDTAYTFDGCGVIDINAPINVGNILVDSSSQTINVNADASFNIIYSSLNSSSTPLNINTTITKDHTIKYSDNTSGSYYLFKSASESIRDSMYNHTTLESTYEFTKNTATLGKIAKDSMYYGVLYLGFVINVTQNKAYTILDDAVADANSNDYIDVVKSHSTNSTITLKDKFSYNIYSSTNASFGGNITVAGSNSTYLFLGANSKYPDATFYLIGTLTIGSKSSSTHDRVQLTNVRIGCPSYCIQLQSSNVELIIDNCTIISTGTKAIDIVENSSSTVSSSITIQNGTTVTATGTDSRAIESELISKVAKRTTVTIKDGTINGTQFALYGGAKYVLYGGEFSGGTYSMTTSYEGQFVIAGGDVKINQPIRLSLMTNSTENNQMIDSCGTASYDIYLDSFSFLSSTITVTVLKLDAGITITKNHTIYYNSNGTTLAGAIYSSTDEATRDSMYDHVTLVDTYTGQKSLSTQGKYTDGTNYYGMLYLGNVVNVTQQKAYMLLGNAVSAATASDEIDVVCSHSAGTVTVDKNVKIYSSTGATYTGDISATSTFYLGVNDGYGITIKGSVTITGAGKTSSSGSVSSTTLYMYNSTISNSTTCVYIKGLSTRLYMRDGSKILVDESSALVNAVYIDVENDNATVSLYENSLIEAKGVGCVGIFSNNDNVIKDIQVNLRTGSKISADKYAVQNAYLYNVIASTVEGGRYSTYNCIVWARAGSIFIGDIYFSDFNAGEYTYLRVTSADAQYNVTFESVDILISDTIKISGDNVTQDHTITFNSNGASGAYYLYSSTSEAIRDSMFEHVTLVDTYTGQKSPLTHGKHTSGSNYYGMLYLGNVVNTTQQKAHLLLSSAISGATAGDTLDIVSSLSESSGITISKDLSITSSTGATFTGDITIGNGVSVTFGTFNQVGTITANGKATFYGAHITANNDTYTLLATSTSLIGIADGTKISNTGSGYAIKSIYGDVNIDGGEIFNGTSITDSVSKGSAIYHDEGGMVIKGGKVHGSNGYVQGNNSRGSLEISNATISGVYYALKVCAMDVFVGEGAIIKRLSSSDSIMPIDLTGTAIIHLNANVTTFNGITVEYRTTIDYPSLEVNTKVTKSYKFELQQIGKNYVFSSTNKDYFDAMYSNAKYYYNYTTEITTKKIESVTSGSTTTYYCVVYVGDVINLTQGTGYSSLGSAVINATAGDTLMIMKALTQTSNINISKNLTLVSYNSSAVFIGKLLIINGTTTFGTSSSYYYGKNTVVASGGSTLTFSYCKISSYDSNPTVTALNASVKMSGDGLVYHSSNGIAMQLGDASNKATLTTTGGTIGSTGTVVGVYIINANVILGGRGSGSNQTIATIYGEQAAITNYKYVVDKENATTYYSSADIIAGSTLRINGAYISSRNKYAVLAKNMDVTLALLYSNSSIGAPIAYYSTLTAYMLTITEYSTTVTNKTITLQLVGESSNKMSTITPEYSITYAPILISDMTSGNNKYKLIVNYNISGSKYLFYASTNELRNAMFINLGGASRTNITANATGNLIINSFTTVQSGAKYLAYISVVVAKVKTTDGKYKYTSLQNAFNAKLSTYDFTILSSSAGSAVLSNGTASVAPIVTLRTASGITHNGKITVYQYSHLKLVNYTASLSDSSNYMQVNSGGYLTIESGTTITSSYVGHAILNNGTLTMNGGTITSTSTGSYGLGIINNNILKMNGGTISVASGATRKGVENAGTFTMTGGYIHMTNVNSTTYGIYNESGASVTIGASTNSTDMPKIEPSFDDGAGYSIYNAGTKTSSSQAYPITFTGFTYSMIIYLYTLDSTYAAINITNLEEVIGFGDDWDVIRLNANVSGYGYYDANATGVSSVMWVQAVYEEDPDLLRTSTEGDSNFNATGSVHSFDSSSKNTSVFSGAATCFDSNSWVYVWDEKKKKIRRKRAKNVTYKDKLLVWNFDKGCFDFANPMFIQKDAIINKYTEITFSDGSKLNVVNDHCVFNVDLGKFCPVVSDFAKYGCPVGSRVLKNDGTIVTVVNKKEIQKEISYTNIITKKHLNCYVNGILTSTPFNNVHKIENMKFVETDKHCENKALLDGIDEEIIKDFRLEEMPDKVLMTSPLHVAGCKTMKDYIDDKLANMKPKD